MVTGLKPPPRIGMQQSNAIYQQMGNESWDIASCLWPRWWRRGGFCQAQIQQCVGMWAFGDSPVADVFWWINQTFRPPDRVQCFDASNLAAVCCFRIYQYIPIVAATATVATIISCTITLATTVATFLPIPPTVYHKTKQWQPPSPSPPLTTNHRDQQQQQQIKRDHCTTTTRTITRRDKIKQTTSTTPLPHASSGIPLLTWVTNTT